MKLIIYDHSLEREERTGERSMENRAMTSARNDSSPFKVMRMNLKSTPHPIHLRSLALVQ